PRYNVYECLQRPLPPILRILGSLSGAYENQTRSSYIPESVQKTQSTPMNTVIHFGQMLVVPSLPILARLWRSAVKQRIGQRFRGPNGDPRIMFVDPDTSEVDNFN